MLIRSQGKEKIINLQETSCIEIDSEGERYLITVIFPGRTGRTIAIYSTEEKAIKVLDMIEDAYNKCFDCFG